MGERDRRMPIEVKTNKIIDEGGKEDRRKRTERAGGEREGAGGERERGGGDIWLK